jgi:protein involved in polysaccharide export with SLBB domain
MISLAAVISFLRVSLGSWSARAVVGVCATLLAASTAAAVPQSGGGSPAGRARSTGSETQPERVVKADTPDATRAELTLLLERTIQQASSASRRASERSRAESEAAEIRRRLEQGDFRPGDRFLITIIADSLRQVDVIVRDGPSIDFGAYPALPLVGILRAELQPAIYQHLAKYFRSPEVRVQFLTRISVIGAVQKPGAHAVPSFILVSDVITQAAGGPLPSANPDEIVVTRGGREVVDKKEFRRAVVEGYTIERLGLQSGDEIRVGTRARRNWRNAVMVGMFSVSIFSAVLALIRSSYSE